MYKTIPFAVMSMAAAVLLLGCETGQPEPTRGAVLDQVQAVEIVEYAQGDDPALEQGPQVSLIQTQEELETLGAESLQALDVDLDQYDLVLVALGEQPTGGYSAEITSLQQVGDTLYVSGYARRPAEGSAVTQQLTYPYAVAVIPNTDAQLASDIQAVEGLADDEG